MVQAVRERKTAETIATVPGLLAALYAAIAFDQGWDQDGLLVRAFGWLCEQQSKVFDGGYYPKLSLLALILPLCGIPAAIVGRWRAQRMAAPPAEGS